MKLEGCGKNLFYYYYYSQWCIYSHVCAADWKETRNPALLPRAMCCSGVTPVDGMKQSLGTKVAAEPKAWAWSLFYYTQQDTYCYWRLDWLLSDMGGNWRQGAQYKGTEHSLRKAKAPGELHCGLRRAALGCSGLEAGGEVLGAPCSTPSLPNSFLPQETVRWGTHW